MKARCEYRPHHVSSALARAIALTCILASESSALPPGRAWTPIDTLKVNGHDYMVPGRFEPLRDGRIELVAAGYHGATESTYGHQTYGLVWDDSTWRIRWTLNPDFARVAPERASIVVMASDELCVDHRGPYLGDRPLRVGCDAASGGKPSACRTTRRPDISRSMKKIECGVA